MRQIDTRPDKEAWVCPVALRAKELGYLGKPGRKHKDCLVYERAQYGAELKDAQ